MKKNLKKLLIVGFKNELTGPALEPYTSNGAGEHLWKMVNAVKPMSKEEYCDRIDFVNVVDAGVEETKKMMENRKVIVCGVETWYALKLKRASFWIDERDGARLIPHPSGRTREYNDPDNRLKTGLLVAEMI